MELDTINKLYLELSQIATAKTAREIELRNVLERANDVCRSMHAIAEREGAETNWPAFKAQLKAALQEQFAFIHATAKTS